MVTIELVNEETGEPFDAFEVEEEEFQEWADAAERNGVTVEELITQALTAYIEKHTTE